MDIRTDVLLLDLEELSDLLTNFIIWELNIILGGSVFLHQVEETIIGDVDLSKR